MDLLRIGRIIKQKRVKLNMSIRELSAKSKIAGSTISQIETGKTSPNLMSLKAVCDALEIPVFSLFLEEDDNNVRLVQKADQESFIRNVSNGKELKETLVTQGKNEMFAAIVVVPPDTDSGPYAYHGGEEFVFVLEGVIYFDLENYRIYELHEQDTLYYPNYIGHRWENRESRPAKILLVTTSPYKI